MYIPIWLIIVGIIVYFIWFRKKPSISRDEPSTAEEMWNSGEYSMKRVMEKSPLSGLEEIGSFDDEREMVKAMANDAIRLRERYMHDPVKQKQIARDWMNYANAVEDVKLATEMSYTDWEDSPYDHYNEKIKEAYTVIREIGKRVENELSKESHIKYVHNKIMKKESKGNLK